jgi:signal transduction histidine kinase
VKLRTRIFLGMACLSVGVTATTLGLSFAFLEPYYLSLKRKQLVDIAREIGELPASVSDMYMKFAALERSTTVHISVVNADGLVVYDTNSPILRQRDSALIAGAAEEGRLPPFAPVARGDQLSPPPPRGEPGSDRTPPPKPDKKGPEPLPSSGMMSSPGESGRIVEVTKDGTIFEMVDPRFSVRLLFLSRRQASGSSLVLSFPLAQATESARGALLFLSISGALALALSAALAYLLAKSTTRPFAELVGLSKSIASLDFSRRFEPRRGDEVAALGGAMNELADSLQKALAELEESNAKLREDVEREKRVDAMRREFISNVSHELKTPIALILGYAEGIMEGVPTDLEARDSYLSVIVDEAKKMDEQVRDLLELSQIESGLLPLSLEEFDLRDIVNESLSSFGRTLESMGVLPELRLESAPARGDRRMIARAFVNYLSNAVSHIDEEGKLAVSVSPMEGGGASLSIYNSGPWIPAKSLELIWDSYYKVDASRKREFGGSGLGLAIVRGIIARHGGSCSVKNEDARDGHPRGVSFGFILPPIR